MNKFTKEDWIAILGKYEDKPTDIPWSVLEGLKPTEQHNSLHILENVYMVDGKRVQCLWAISSDEDEPFSICEQVERT